MPAQRSTGLTRRMVAIGGVVALAVLGLVVAAALVVRGGGSGGSPTHTAAQATQHVSRPDLGFALDVPSAWTVDLDQTPGSVFFARSTPPTSSVRIFRGETGQPLDQNVGNVVAELGQQGAHGFAQQPVQVGDLAGIRLDYVADDGPGGAPANHSSYRVKNGSTVVSLVLSTTDPVGQGPVLAAIASSFRVL